MNNPDNLAQQLDILHDRISTVAIESGQNPDKIQLLAVSKKQPLEKLRAAYDAGQRAFGESFIQEALSKIEQLSDKDIHWHFIGRLQSNKISKIARHFDWVHSLSSLDHAKKLSSCRPEDLPPINVCIQVNLSKETSKSGIASDELADLATEIGRCSGLQLRGLMTMPNPMASTEQQQNDYTILNELQQHLNDQGFNLDTLSMGMSNDYPLAIAAGATIIRIGTALFGSRS